MLVMICDKYIYIYMVQPSPRIRSIESRHKSLTVGTEPENVIECHCIGSPENGLCTV